MSIGFIGTGSMGPSLLPLSNWALVSGSEEFVVTRKKSNSKYLTKDE